MLMKVEKFICLSEKRSLGDCNSVAKACLGEMSDIIESVAGEVAGAAAERRGGDDDGDLTIEIQGLGAKLKLHIEMFNFLYFILIKGTSNQKL